MKKRCFKCRNIKDINDFHIHNGMADKHLNKCKRCVIEYVHTWYHNPETLDKRIAYEKKRYMQPDRKKAKLRYQQRSRKNSPGKHRARYKVATAIRNGQLKKGVCEICKSTKVEAHHDDYRRYLQIRWLCRKHHMLLESKRSWI